MDFELSDEQRAIQETARAFAAERLKPCADEWDAKGLFPDEALRAGAALGFGGICIGEDV
ncbi:MAG: acyl-CoA dehydrogenase, partial [Alphaproteobacteria bacterium]|nr:acyl-CoA dehydrogenase [Alphaproteobacteria bacterium]